MNAVADPTNITSLQRTLIIIAVMSTTLMQVLDTTIVNVALPHMQGSLSATSDQITWTLTSYLVSSAIFMPLTGYFTDRLGRKQFALVCIIGFTISSALCGASTSLAEIVLFRIAQGVFGAGIVPLSQAILSDIHTKEEQGKAMAIWGAGVMIGPILGPTLGGYLTDVASWRWTFYINVPVGILSAYLTWVVVPDTLKKPRDLDWWGLFLLSMGIGALQIFLDRGNQDGWFDSGLIQLMAVLTVTGIIGFVIHSLKPHKKEVFNVRMFRDTNFAGSCLVMGMLGIGLFGGMVVLPLYLENLMNYPVLTTGLVMAPRGITSMISMIVVARLIGKVNPRNLIGIGIIISVIGIYACTDYSLNISPYWIIWPILLQGFGLGMIFVPLSTMAYSTLPKSALAEATGLFSLLRTVGASIGISIVITIFTRHTQMAWNQIGGLIQPYNPALNQYLQPLHLHPTDPLAAAILGNTLAQQAQMSAFLDVYMFIVWSFILMLPLLLLLKRPTSIKAVHIE